MRKTLIAAAVVSFVAFGATGVGAKDILSDKYFSVNTPAPLTQVDQKALKVARDYNKSIAAPTSGFGGTVEFAFGNGQPTIVCAPLYVTDITLQVGETINALQMGDSVRWSLEPMMSGGPAGDRVHIIVKPKDVGLETNLIIGTNKRVYNLRLKSTRHQYLPAVSFSYPEVEMTKWHMANKAKMDKQERETIPETGERISNLDFEYAVKGNAVWKPLRVYNDRSKTYIDMPATIDAEEVPTILTLRDTGSVFSDEETEIINYRYQNGRFIIDGVPEKLILISGVGSEQQRITLTRKNAPKAD